MANYRVIFHDGMDDGEYLEHFGIKGMKWGVRRYQNPDGSLTPEGKARYRSQSESDYQEHLKYYVEYMDPKGYVIMTDKSGKKDSMTRYQTYTKTVSKKDGTFWEYSVDMLNQTGVGKKRLMKYTDKDGMGAKVLKEENLSEQDFDSIERELRERYSGSELAKNRYAASKRWRKQHGIK